MPLMETVSDDLILYEGKSIAFNLTEVDSAMHHLR